MVARRCRVFVKVQIEINENLEEDYVTIHCRELNGNIMRIQEVLSAQQPDSNIVILHRDEKEFYVPLKNILFFETENKIVMAHTKTEMYESDYKLYELEEILPGYFKRISKSAIVNLNHVYSITKNITASSLIEFANCHKQVYVSRNYYKALVDRLAEKRRKI